MAIQQRLPVAQGANTGFTSINGVDRWLEVDDPVGSPDEDATYIFRSNSNSQNGFIYTAFDITSSAVASLSVVIRSRMAAGAADVRARLTVNGTQYNSSASAMSSAYANYTFTWLTNPNTGAAWTEADVEGTGAAPFQEAAVSTLNMGGGEECRCSQIYVEGDYTEASVSEGSGAAALTLGASGVGQRLVAGFAVAALALGLSGAGEAPAGVSSEGSGTVALSLGAAGAGAAQHAGTGTAGLGLATSGAGVALHAGTGSAALVLGAAGVGVHDASGAGTATLVLTSSGTGTATHAGTGAADLVLALQGSSGGAATGDGTAALTLTVLGSGERLTTGDGAAAVTLSASGTGEAPAVPPANGTGVSALTLGASGTGVTDAIGAGAAPLALTLHGEGGLDTPTMAGRWSLVNLDPEQTVENADPALRIRSFDESQLLEW